MYIQHDHYKKKLNYKNIIKEIFLIYLSAVIFVLIFNSFFFQAFKIPSNSMEPQIHGNSLIIVNKLVYGTKFPFSDKRMFDNSKKIKRGDVIVFMSHEYYNKNKFYRIISSIVYTLSFSFIDINKFDKENVNIYIKRIIGLPNDTIKYQIKDGRVIVLINDIPEFEIIKGKYQIINEDQNNSLLLEKMLIQSEYKVKNGEYYVLGDNRLSSIDSRIWEGIKLEQIIGKAVLKYFPKIEKLK